MIHYEILDFIKYKDFLQSCFSGLSGLMGIMGLLEMFGKFAVFISFCCSLLIRELTLITIYICLTHNQQRDSYRP